MQAKEREITEDGVIVSPGWDEEWVKRINDLGLGKPICGAKIQVGTMPIRYEPCLKDPDTRFGRCKLHHLEDKLYEDDIFKAGLAGIRVCGEACESKCENYRTGFELRAIRPFCFKEYETYTTQLKELLAELEANKIEVRQYIKIAIQSIAMTLIQIMRCDQELAGGNMVLIEKQLFKSRDNERTIETPKENPAIAMKTKLLKSLAELAKTLMISPREKAEDKTKAPAKSAAEFMMDIVGKTGGLDGGHMNAS